MFFVHVWHKVKALFRQGIQLIDMLSLEFMLSHGGTVFFVPNLCSAQDALELRLHRTISMAPVTKVVVDIDGLELRVRC